MGVLSWRLKFSRNAAFGSNQIFQSTRKHSWIAVGRGRRRVDVKQAVIRSPRR